MATATAVNYDDLERWLSVVEAALEVVRGQGDAPQAEVDLASVASHLRNILE